MGRAILKCAAFLLLTAACAGAPAQAMSGRLRAAERAVDTEAAGHPHGSMTVAIVVRGRLAWVKSYGFADAARRLRATPATLYRIGSITKQLTGFALLRLVEEGRVRLDDPVIRHVPEAASALGQGAGRIDLLALATHRAGLSREPDNWQVYSTGAFGDWQRLAREALGQSHAPFRPLDRGRYSNIGYAALGLAIERASGMAYTDYVETRLLRPLGMRATSFRPDRRLLARLAEGHRSSQGADTAQSAAELAAGRGYRIPNGGLFSTAPDLARFLAFEMGAMRHPPIGPAAVRANLDRSFPGVDGGRFGVGFIVETHGGRRLIGHNGLATGYASAAYFDPETQIGIVCLASAENLCQSRFIDAYAALSPAWVPVAARLHAARAATAARIAAQRPYPEGETMLRAFIRSLAAGTPDYARLGERLGGAVRDNEAALRMQFAGLGEIRSITFLGVSPAGADQYEVRFAGGALRWVIVLDDMGRIESAVMRAIP